MNTVIKNPVLKQFNGKNGDIHDADISVRRAAMCYIVYPIFNALSQSIDFKILSGIIIATIKKKKLKELLA